MRNVQRRRVGTTAQAMGRVLDQVGDPDRTPWPSRWPPLELDRGLTVGSVGGHGPIRYSVSAVDLGRRVRFAFDRRSGFVGHHQLELVPDGVDAVVVVHSIEARTTGAMLLRWPLAVRWLHEALTKDLLDRMELQATGTVAGTPARWSPWVRLLRRAMTPRRRRGVSR